MTDQDYQAGMVAAIRNYQASVSFPIVDFSFTYTQAPVQLQAPETVQVSF